MGKFVFAVIFVLIPNFAFAANMCVRLFADTKAVKFDFSNIDSTTMSSVDYLMLQHRKWQQRNGIEYYTKEQLNDFAIKAKAGDQRALENLISSNIPIVVKEVAKRVSRHNPIFAELISQTLLGVYDVVRRYEPQKENANFLQALKNEVRNVLKNHRRNDEVIDYGVKYYNEMKDHLQPIRDHYINIGQKLTPELLVKEYRARFSIELSLKEAQELIFETKYSTFRENSEKDSGFNLYSLKDKTTTFTTTSITELSYVYRAIDQIKQELNNSEFVRVFELFYGLTKQGGHTEASIAEILDVPQYRIKWIIRDKIKKTVKKVLEDKEFDREVFELGLKTYSGREQKKLNIKNTDNVHQEFQNIYFDFLNKKSPLEAAKALRVIEPKILKSKDNDLIFEFHYFMVEILLEAKKYELAYKKSQELLKTGKNWNEHHNYFFMLHHTAGKSAYHIGSLKEAEAHLRYALVTKGASFETWFYYAKTMEKINSSTSFEKSFQSFILYMTTLHKINLLLDTKKHTPKELDTLKTIEHLAEQGLQNHFRALKSAHGFNALSRVEINKFTEAAQQKDHNGIINSMLPLYESLINTPHKRLKKLKLEGPTAKAFHIYLGGLVTSLHNQGRFKESERVIKFLEEL